MNKAIRKFLKEEDGITALEYGLLAALVAVVLLAVVGSDSSSGLGLILKNLFNKVATSAGVGTAT